MIPEVPTTQLEYSVPVGKWDGMLTELPDKLAGCIEFDAIGLDGMPTSKRVTLWFRSGAKKVFHVRLIRKAGRCLVEMGGVEPATALAAIKICRNHFDRWFGITPGDILRSDRKDW